MTLKQLLSLSKSLTIRSIYCTLCTYILWLFSFRTFRKYLIFDLVYTVETRSSVKHNVALNPTVTHIVSSLQSSVSLLPEYKTSAQISNHLKVCAWCYKSQYFRLVELLFFHPRISKQEAGNQCPAVSTCEVNPFLHRTVAAPVSAVIVLSRLLQQ